MIVNTTTSILQEINPWFLNNTNKKLFIKRDDLLDPFISGNKWRKLFYNLEHATQHQYKGIVTFGGAYSNHLLATAVACDRYGIKAAGIVRGDELNAQSNELLKVCGFSGMDLKFISRSAYDRRNDLRFKDILNQWFEGYYVLPEGGANAHGVMGCQYILPECGRSFDQVFVAQGTSTTSCGILMSLRDNTQLHVVPVLKGYDAIGEMRQLLLTCSFEKEKVEENLLHVKVHPEAHFGGYGKYTSELLHFMEQFYHETGVPIDPVYTGKALFALMEYCKQTSGHHEDILFVHTGGIHGGKAIAIKEQRTFS